MEPPWYEDVARAFRPPVAARFFPAPEDDRVQAGNAVFRLCAYTAVALAVLFRRLGAAVAVACVGALGTYVYIDSGAGPGGAPSAKAAPAAASVRPTASNPHMNVLWTDFADRPSRGPAQDVTLPATAAAVAAAESASVPAVRADGLFDRDHAARPFYTTASTTIPNDQGSFASFLYGTGPTLKERALEHV